MAQFTWTNGYDPSQLGKSINMIATSITKDDSYALEDSEKTAFIALTASAASKTITLGLEEGECSFVANVGATNALTLKNVSGESGTSLATGKVALVIASKTANASKIYVLN